MCANHGPGMQGWVARAREYATAIMPASISSRPMILAALAMILGHAPKLQHFMCAGTAGSQSKSCRLRGHVLSGAVYLCARAAECIGA